MNYMWCFYTLVKNPRPCWCLRFSTPGFLRFFGTFFLGGEGLVNILGEPSRFSWSSRKFFRVFRRLMPFFGDWLSFCFTGACHLHMKFANRNWSWYSMIESSINLKKFIWVPSKNLCNWKQLWLGFRCVVAFLLVNGRQTKHQMDE